MKVAHSCLTLCDPMDNTVHGNLQARILEWVAGFSQPRDRTQVSHIAGGFFTSWATREAQEYWNGLPFPSQGDLLDLGIKLMSPALAGRFFTTEPTGKPTLQDNYNLTLQLLFLLRP